MPELFDIESTSNTKEYIKYALNSVMCADQLEISGSIRLIVQRIGVGHLGLKDINKLRDRLDGQSYLNKLLLKVVASKAIEKSVAGYECELKKLEVDRNFDLTKVLLNKKTYRIIPFYFGNLPMVSEELQDPIIFCAVKPDFRSVAICGVLSNYHFDDVRLFASVSSPTQRGFKKFIGFNFLEALS